MLTAKIQQYVNQVTRTVLRVSFSSMEFVSLRTPALSVTFIRLAAAFANSAQISVHSVQALLNVPLANQDSS